MAPRSLAAVPDKISIHQKSLSRDLRDGLPHLGTNNRWLPKVWPDPSAMARKKTCKAKKMRKPSGKLQFGPYSLTKLEPFGPYSLTKLEHCEIQSKL